MKQKKTSKTIYGFAAALAVLLLTLCIAASPAAADDTPTLPMQVYGAAVDTNGNPLSVGTEITAEVDSITSAYVIKEAGKIGGPNTFDEKFLITGKTSGNTVVFSVNGVESEQTVAFASGETVRQLNLPFAVFEKTFLNANKSASIVKPSTPENLSSVTVPLFINQKSGKSILLNDSVVVKAVISGVEQTLPAKIVGDKVELVDPESAAGADSLTVEFIGKKLGDSDGDGQVTVNDAVKVAQSLVSIVELNEKGEFYGDADSDGDVTVNDAVKVAQRLVGLVDENYE